MACNGNIPNTFIMCGEGKNYCSTECQIDVAIKNERKRIKEALNKMDTSNYYGYSNGYGTEFDAWNFFNDLKKIFDP